MTVDVTLYHFNGDNRQISKTLQDGISYKNVVFRSSVDFHDIDFDLEDKVDDTYNYCKIVIHFSEDPDDDIAKYYYINIINTRENLTTVSGRIDVLMTYKDGILALPVWCRRSAVLQTPYIPDPKAPIEARRYVAGLPNDTIGAHSTDMILITVG